MTRFRVWLQASRPRTLTAAVAPVAIGVGLAVFRGKFAPMPALAALVGAILIQVGTNFANDYYDFVRGGDTDRRVGPLRVTQAGLVEPADVRRAMFLAFALATLVGLYLVAVGGRPILIIGILSLLSGWAYTGGPFPLAYNGLGDAFVLLFFGPVAVAGTYWVQSLEYRPEAVTAGLGVGAVATAILAANNLRDLESDRVARKRTLPVLLGRGAGRAEFVLLLLVASVVPLVGVARMGWPPTVLLALLGVGAALSPLRTILKESQAEALVPALPATARAAGLYGLLLGLGFALGRLF